MREALKLALEALRDIIEGSRLDVAGNRNDDGLIDHDGVHNFKLRISAAHTAIEAVKEALAQPEQEPAVFARRWKLAIDGFGLQRDDDNGNYVDIEDALSVLHHLLSAQPEQEPIAWINPDEQNAKKAFHWVESEKFTSAVYTTPPKREWVGLTDDERAECWRSSAKQSAINIEAKLKELNK